jgi:hypothetical protein
MDATCYQTGKAGRDRESQKTCLKKPHMKAFEEEVVMVKVNLAFIPSFREEGWGF